MFTTIVVPLDGSASATAAVEPAAALARRAGAAVELITVTSPGMGTLDEELDLKAACANLVDVECSYRVIESNDVESSLASAVADVPDAILCMATHGRTGVPRAVLGSTAEGTVRAVTRPVVLIGPHARVPDRWEVVQACVDTASDDSRRAVPVAVALARVFGARLWLTEVQPARELPEATDVPETAGLATLAATLHRDGVDVEWEVFHGDDVAAELLRAQSLLQSTLLVTSTHARAGLARTALGSVAADLVHAAPCPVVVVPSVHGA